MEFTLHYRGDLTPNGTREEKHALRRHFHAQLKELWDRAHTRSRFPYGYVRRYLFEEPYARKVGPVTFAALVTEHQTAELSITMLRPELPGSIIRHGGDIDNRLKTLFDSLRMPQESNELPSAAAPEPSEEGVLCLLEDDQLISGITVRTFELLEPGVEPPSLILVIHVRIQDVRENAPRLAELRQRRSDG